MARTTLLLACGALAKEIAWLIRRNGWTHLQVRYLPADWHNHPERIAPEIDRRLTDWQENYRACFVAYGDCGTGGLLDAVLSKHGVERLPGAHCYEFFSGTAAFVQLMDEEPGTFFLTDFLVRHFEKLITKGLGLDRHPQLLDMYFGNYQRLVYLTQLPAPELDRQAQQAAVRLGLTYEQRLTGLDGFAANLSALNPQAASCLS